MTLLHNRRKALATALLGTLGVACPWYVQAQASAYPENQSALLCPIHPAGALT